MRAGRRLGGRAEVVVAIGLVVASLEACSSQAPTPSASATPYVPLSVLSTAFRDGSTIPLEYGCDYAPPVASGAPDPHQSPALAWTGAPASVKAVAVTAIDLDAHDYVHWLAANVSPGSDGSGFLARGASGSEAAGVEGRNSAGKNGWTPPCPPPGDGKHRYRFTVYGLTEQLPVEAGFSLSDLQAAMEGRIVATGSITGLYARAS